MIQETPRSIKNESTVFGGETPRGSAVSFVTMVRSS